MFLELDQEERERELEQLEDQLKASKGESKQVLSPEEYQRKGKRILLAAEKGNLFDLVRFIHDEPALVNFADQDGYTALHRASYGGNIDCAKYLVRHGANIEAKTNDDWRPLHCAVRWNNVSLADYLVSQGADVNARSNGNNTPLHLVCSNGRYSLTSDIIQLLLFHPNCDYTIKNQSGDTAFDIAKRSGPFYRFWVGVITLSPDDMSIKTEEDS